MAKLRRTCDATIAICTYNRVKTLPLTLASLHMLRGPYTFEVIVVNGPSTDGTTEFLAEQDSIRVFDNPETNLSISRNIAIANAAGRYVAFIDDDAIPEPDWLTLLLNRFGEDQSLSALGGFIRDANGMTFQAKYVFCDTFGIGYPCDNVDYATFAGKDRRLYPSLTGTNVIFRKADLLKISGFDEVFAYFLDETDVNKRMDDAGMKVEVLPHAEIHHKYAPSHLRTEKNVSRNMYPIARSIGYFTLKHGVPEHGWEAASRRLQDFYEAEFKWKQESYSYQNLTRHDFEALMVQTRQGIIDGVNCYFDPTPEPALPENRIARHDTATPPVVRQMRKPEDALRLCMFSQDHAREGFGGIGRWTNLVARGLAERGHEVTVIGELANAKTPEYCDFTKDGFWSHNLFYFDRENRTEIDCLGLPNSMANTSKRKLAEIRRIMPRRQFQVASSPIWDVEGAALIGSGDVPTVLSLHTCAGLMLESKPEWKDNKEYYQNHVLRVINAEIQALRRTPMILANSTAIMRDISELYGLDLFARPHAIVPHGIDDIESPEPLLETRTIAHEKDGDPLRIIFLGRLETRKGVAHMVPVLDRLLETHKNVVVDLVGQRVDDVNHKLVKDLIAKYPSQVTWHGYLNDENLDRLMRQSDIFFGPSLYESFGLIYVEAMRYSIPCVAYAAGGVTEVIEHGVDGFLATLGDQEGLFDGLEQLVTNDMLRTKMSMAARQNFIQKFHYGLMADRLVEVYRDTAKRSGTA